MPARRIIAIVMATIGALITVAGIILAVADHSLFDDGEVERTTRTIVKDRDVKRLLNREITDRVVAIGGLEDQRDLVQPFVVLILEDPRVEAEVVDGVMAAYDELIDGDARTIVFNLEEMADEVRAQVVQVVPQLDDQLPPADELLRFDLLERRDLPELFDFIDTMRQAAWYLLVAGVLIVATAVVLGPGRFSVFGVASLVVVAATFLTATWISVASDHAIDSIDDDLSRRVARLATDEYLSNLDDVAIAVIIFGLIGVIVGIGGSWIIGALFPERSYVKQYKAPS